MIGTTTPKAITRSIRELCSRLRTVDEPAFLRVEPRPDSQIGDCFNDVKRHVHEHGGSLVHGWLLWEWPGIMVEAEFHGVWRSPDGALLDVSKKPEAERVVLFAADTVRNFTGSRVNNVRHAVGKNPKIKTLIQDQNRFYKLFQQQHGDATGNVELGDELAELHYQRQVLAQELAQSSEARSAWARFRDGHPYLPTAGDA
jgi:hypothetical protein